MPSIASLLGDPITNVLSAAGAILDKFVASPEDKIKAQLQLAQLEADTQKSLATIDEQFAAQQASVVMAETKSDSWMARNWRPILMLTFTYIIAHTYVLVPLFGLRSVAIPPDMWELLKLGIGGYVIGRSAEKIAPSVVDALSKGK